MPDIPRIRPMQARRLLRAWPLLAAVALAACAGTPPPKAELAVAQAAVANANSAGALQWAPAEMRSAQDKLGRAEAAMVAKENAQALTLANEASADAALAAAAARAAKAQRAAVELQEANRVLGEEIARKQAQPAAKTP
jgi:peptidoglycan/LPS O-acetylase OafA/YrhL